MGEAAVVVDHHVQVVPAGAPVEIADLVAEDTLAGLPEASQPTFGNPSR